MKALDFLAQTPALLTDRVRLAIMATLAAAREPMEFAALLDVLGVTKGNLSSHAQKLERAGLIEIKKEFIGRKPQTTYLCTELGKGEIQKYLKHIESILKKIKE